MYPGPPAGPPEQPGHWPAPVPPQPEGMPPGPPPPPGGGRYEHGIPLAPGQRPFVPQPGPPPPQAFVQAAPQTFEYKVVQFRPTLKGCGAKDIGWDGERCSQWTQFLNQQSAGGWRLHSSEFMLMKSSNCSGVDLPEKILTCVFEKRLA